MEHHAFQGLHPVFQGHFGVHLEEIHGVAEAGPQHPLVALAHHVGVPGQGIIHRDEMGQQLAVLAPQGKIALVLPHGGDEHLVGQGQEFFVKAAHHHRGIFHQKGVLFQQPRVGHHLAAHPGRGLGQLLFQVGPAGRRVHDDLGVLQGRQHRKPHPATSTAWGARKRWP